MKSSLSDPSNPLDLTNPVGQNVPLKLVIEKTALRRLDSMPPSHQKGLRRHLQAIAANPFASHPNVKPLVDNPNTYRVRQGDWRAIYEIDLAAKIIRVLKIEPRGSAYR